MAQAVASTFMTLASELEGIDPNARRGRRRERARPELPPRGPRGGRPRRHESILYLTPTTRRSNWLPAKVRTASPTHLGLV